MPRKLKNGIVMSDDTDEAVEIEYGPSNGMNSFYGQDGFSAMKSLGDGGFLKPIRTSEG